MTSHMAAFMAGLWVGAAGGMFGLMLFSGGRQARADRMEAILRVIAETPKHGEPCPEAREYEQSWDDEGGRYAIEALHRLIESARPLIAEIDAIEGPSRGIRF